MDFINDFKLKANVLPETILYFLHKLPSSVERKRYIFTNWLAKVMCKELGDYGLTQLPRMSQVFRVNMDFIYQAFDNQNEFSDLCDV